MRLLHALSAAWKMGLPRSTPELRLIPKAQSPPGLRLGPGKLGNPCERMH
jgi:hypothetical protein